MIRGLTAVDEITPKFAAETLVLGLLNCVVLKALKNSERNSRLALSPSALSDVRLMSVRSKFLWSGPKTVPTPLFPKAVASPSSPTTGQAPRPCALSRMQLLLKYLPSLLFTEPEVVRSL